MTTPVSDSDAGSAVEYGGPGTVVGTCRWCHRPLRYVRPGSPPGDCLTDEDGFYLPPYPYRDYGYFDIEGEFGRFCPYAPAHPLGQYSVHQL